MAQRERGAHGARQAHCLGKCAFDGDGLCTTCGRTTEEIMRGPALPLDYELSWDAAPGAQAITRGGGSAARHPLDHDRCEAREFLESA